MANTYRERSDISYKDDYIEIPNGTEVTLKRIIKNDEDKLPNYLRYNAEIIYEGQSKYIYAWNLRFSDKNPEGTKDVLKEYNMSPNMFVDKNEETGETKIYNALDLRSPEGEMLMSPFYILAILVLLLSPIVLHFIFIRSQKKGVILFKSLYTVLAIICAIIMEGYYLIRLGGLAIWFCDVEFHSTLRAAINGIPLLLAIIAQFMSLSLVYFPIKENAEKRGKKIRLLPSFILPILAFVACCILLVKLPSEFLGIEEGAAVTSEQFESAMKFILAVFLIGLPAPSALYYGIKLKLRGLFLGIFLTFYWIGTAFAIGFLILAIIKLFIAIFFQVLIFVAGAFVVLWVLPKSGISGHYVKNGRVVDSDTPGAKYVADTSSPLDDLFDKK